ncbi:MAG: hypothetical protein V9G10_09775 [Candidatus Nanopelagicales bacterium]
MAFGYAVFKKYADDEGSRLAALLAYYTLFGIFPLAIGGYAILRMIAENNPDLVNDLVRQVVPPSFQQQIIDSYASLPGSGPALVVALLGSAAGRAPVRRSRSTPWSIRSSACPTASGTASGRATCACCRCCWMLGHRHRAARRDIAVDQPAPAGAVAGVRASGQSVHGRRQSRLFVAPERCCAAGRSSSWRDRARRGGRGLGRSH